MPTVTIQQQQHACWLQGYLMDCNNAPTCYTVHVGDMSNLQRGSSTECWYGYVAYAIYEHQNDFVRQRGPCWGAHSCCNHGRTVSAAYSKRSADHTALEIVVVTSSPMATWPVGDNTSASTVQLLTTIMDCGP